MFVCIVAIYDKLCVEYVIIVTGSAIYYIL